VAVALAAAPEGQGGDRARALELARRAITEYRAGGGHEDPRMLEMLEALEARLQHRPSEHSVIHPAKRSH
jgi:hypothetical protein